MLTLTNLKPTTLTLTNLKPTTLTLTNLKPQTQNVDTDKPRSVSPMLQQTQLSTAQQVYDLLLLWSPCVIDQQTLCTFISAHHILIFTQQRMPWTARHAHCCYVYNKKVLRLECKSQPAHRCCTCNTVVCTWCQSDHTHTHTFESLTNNDLATFASLTFTFTVQPSKSNCEIKGLLRVNTKKQFWHFHNICIVDRRPWPCLVAAHQY